MAPTKAGLRGWGLFSAPPEAMLSGRAIGPPSKGRGILVG